jgi:hypothetical protein
LTYESCIVEINGVSVNKLFFALGDKMACAYQNIVENIVNRDIEIDEVCFPDL